MVQVKKVTKEDRWAVQLIDTYVQLESVKSRGLEGRLLSLETHLGWESS